MNSNNSNINKNDNNPETFDIREVTFLLIDSKFFYLSVYQIKSITTRKTLKFLTQMNYFF